MSERFVIYVFVLTPAVCVCFFLYSVIWATTTVTVSWLVMDLRRNGRSSSDKDVALDPDLK